MTILLHIIAPFPIY